MTWRLSPHSSLWPTSAPEPPRAVHGTQRHIPGLPRWVARAPSLRTAKRKKKKNRGSESPLSAAPVVAAASGVRGERNKCPRPQRGVTAAHVLCTPTVATAPRSDTRSSSLRSASASGAGRPPGMPPHLVAGIARKGSTTARWSRENGTSGISHPRGS
jgi:hypothetical protein